MKAAIVTMKLLVGFAIVGRLASAEPVDVAAAAAKCEACHDSSSAAMRLVPLLR
jgi:hypothetical protein